MSIMEKNFCITELEDIYHTLKHQEDYKTSLHVLKLIASIQGYLKHMSLKEKALSDFSDEELDIMMTKLKKDHGYA
jgi:hypothetical protein